MSKITISYRTAEYLACLAGQIPWGNQARRSSACAELGEALNEAQRGDHTELQKTLECFENPTWDVHVKPAGSKK